MDYSTLVRDIRRWGEELGFQQVGITDIDLSTYAPAVRRWIADGFNGSMGYMADQLDMRLDPAQLLPGTVRVIAARMDYLPADTEPIAILNDPTRGYVSRYALGRDYHKLVRARLTTLAERIRDAAAPTNCRAFTDSAPILEKALAQKAGLGWIGKNTLVLNRQGRLVLLPRRNLHRPAVADRCARRR